MSLSRLGQHLRTNAVTIGEDQVTKQFKPWAIADLWGFLERKPRRSARERFDREHRMIEALTTHPDLITPTLIAADPEALVLTFERLELTSLVQILEDPDLHPDDKLMVIQRALQALHHIHNDGHTHGDPYLKNFFTVEGDDHAGAPLYTCDFEYDRLSPVPEITDVMLLTANAIALTQGEKLKPSAVLQLVRDTYGPSTHFPLDIRDRIFFTLRFKMGPDFFAHFENNRTLLTG